MALIDDRQRRLVPRWRLFKVAARLGSLDSQRSSGRPSEWAELSIQEVEELRRAWIRNKTIIHAADLVDAALVTDLHDRATDAAEFLLEAEPSGITQLLAKSLLAAPEGNVSETDVQLTRVDCYKEIARARRHLARTPNDPIGWIDLARHYSVLGQRRPAERALDRGLALAPDNRFVLRAASRFYIHYRRPDRAQVLLRRSARTQEDPWLLAAEIVATCAAGETSRWISHGRRMVESGAFEPRHTTELAGAIGTLEHDHGNRRRVRRCFEHALIDPTENTVAQAGWLARHMRGFDHPADPKHVPRAFEAGAWHATLDEQYEIALRLAWKWLFDEPFSTRPALFGSWLAVTALGDYESGAEIIEAARTANYWDPRLIAQLVFCYASVGELDKAERLLSELLEGIRRYPTIRPQKEWDVLVSADRGLIAFRKGEIDLGRRLYKDAITSAKESGLTETAAIALLYSVREEARLKSVEQRHVTEVNRALDAFAPSIRPAYKLLLQRYVGRVEPGSRQVRIRFVGRPDVSY